MNISLATLGAAALSLVVAAPSLAAQQLYFRNNRVMEVQSYEVKGPVIHITLSDGNVVVMREATVDWEATSRLTDADIVLRPGEYEQAGGAAAGAGAGGTLTSSQIRGYRGALRRASAARSGHGLQVYASRGWTDTGVDLRSQDLVVLARGRVSVTPELSVGPAGDSSGMARGTPLVGSFPFGALIGRIGDAGTPFLVGSRLTLPLTERGRLYLSVNDRTTTDNKGAFDVEIQAAGAMSGSGGMGASNVSSSAAGSGSSSSGSAQPTLRQGMGRGIDKAKAMRDSLPR